MPWFIPFFDFFFRIHSNVKSRELNQELNTPQIEFRDYEEDKYKEIYTIGILAYGIKLVIEC